MRWKSWLGWARDAEPQAGSRSMATVLKIGRPSHGRSVAPWRECDIRFPVNETESRIGVGSNASTLDVSRAG